MKPFTKIVNLGLIPLYHGRRANVYCQIRYYSNSRDRMCLSITGVIGPYANGNCAGACGQISEYLCMIDKFAKGWTKERVQQFTSYWMKYHLNVMYNIEVPEDVVKWLYTLPDTGRRPAWV